MQRAKKHTYFKASKDRKWLRSTSENFLTFRKYPWFQLSSLWFCIIFGIKKINCGFRKNVNHLNLHGDNIMVVYEDEKTFSWKIINQHINASSRLIWVHHNNVYKKLNPLQHVHFACENTFLVFPLYWMDLSHVVRFSGVDWA
jgi:hypothetical protein